MPSIYLTKGPIFLPYEPGELCSRCYPGHPGGCPNYGTRRTCPPKAKLWGPVWAKKHFVWVIYNVFPFGAHVAKMRRKHPDWSERQLACCLYWQGKARKQLEWEIQYFLRHGKWYGEDLARLKPKIERCPEAHGVNVTATMAMAGVCLQWPPKDRAYQVALAYAKRRGARK